MCYFSNRTFSHSLLSNVISNTDHLCQIYFSWLFRASGERVPPHKWVPLTRPKQQFTKNTGLHKVVRPCKGLIPVQCRKIKEVGDSMTGPTTEVPVNMTVIITILRCRKFTKYKNRCLFNQTWIVNYPISRIEHSTKTCLDHVPILISLFPRNYPDTVLLNFKSLALQ